jgi:hypothetical protein
MHAETKLRARRHSICFDADVWKTTVQIRAQFKLDRIAQSVLPRNFEFVIYVNFGKRSAGETCRAGECDFVVLFCRLPSRVHRFDHFRRSEIDYTDCRHCCLALRVTTSEFRRAKKW